MDEWQFEFYLEKCVTALFIWMKGLLCSRCEKCLFQKIRRCLGSVMKGIECF